MDWNDVPVITTLYQLFLGTRNSKENIKAEYRRVPACTRLRLKLFTYLIRSREASTLFPFCIQVFIHCFVMNYNSLMSGFKCLFPVILLSVNLRGSLWWKYQLEVKADGATIPSSDAIQVIESIWIIFKRHYHLFDLSSTPETRLAAISPVLISGLMKIINTQGVSYLISSDMNLYNFIWCIFLFQDSKLRGSALVALGKLGQKLPEAVTKDMAIIQMLFNAMETVTSISNSIIRAINSWSFIAGGAGNSDGCARSSIDDASGFQTLERSKRPHFRGAVGHVIGIAAASSAFDCRPVRWKHLPFHSRHVPIFTSAGHWRSVCNFICFYWFFLKKKKKIFLTNLTWKIKILTL